MFPFRNSKMSRQCRLCAKFTESVIDLFLEHESTLLTKINSFLPTTISNGRGLPTKICCKCVERANETHSFIQEVILAQEVFGISFESPIKKPVSENSVMYGGITISSTRKAAINVPPTNVKAIHKKSQNVSETLKKLKKIQTGMTISKTIVPGVIAVRKCKTEPKSYADDYDDNGDEKGDDEDNDPSYNGYASDENHGNGNDNDMSLDPDDDYTNDDDDDDDDNDGDSDYQPEEKRIKTITKTRSQIKSNKPHDSESNSKSIKINSPPVFLCMKCRCKFNSLDDLKQHVLQRNACTTTQLTCKVCDKRFETRKSLMQHAKVHEEKPKFICDKCGKMYTNQFNLENHKSSQHGEYVDECHNVFKCRICNEKYTNRTDLYLHMKTHTKDKQQLLCDTCSKCFTNSHNLRSHQKVHLDIRPFDCTMCDKKFRTRLLLKQHMHVHTGIKEFSCVCCSQSFAKADSLRLHTRKRHPEVPPGSHKIKLTVPTDPSNDSPENSAPMLGPFAPISTSSFDTEQNDVVTQKTEIDVVNN